VSLHYLEKIGLRPEGPDEIEQQFINAIESFNWGMVYDVHDVGPYRIAEYHPRKVEGFRITRQVDQGRSEFHAWIVQDGKLRDTNHCYPTLDHALAGLIAHRWEGVTHHADSYFMASLEGLKARTQAMIERAKV
jgi:hypothetical protein